MMLDDQDRQIPALNDWLRGRHALTGVAPEWDLDTLPAEPTVLFHEWMLRAAADGVAEPHTATLATVDAEGVPDARTLILKGIDGNGWAFASTRSSRKGAQLAQAPAAALNFWWQPQVRAVRVRGRVEEASAEESAADLAARSSAAQEGIASGDWVRWRVIPSRIEFWQGLATAGTRGWSTSRSVMAGRIRCSATDPVA